MTVIDTLTLALGVDTSGIASGLANAQRQIDAGAKSLAQSLLAPFKAALGAVAAGLSFGAVTSQYLREADAIGKLAKSIDANVEELQAWGSAAARAGGSAEAFNGTVQGLTRNLQNVAKNAKGPAAQALQELGIRATDASGKARDTFDVLHDIAGAMEGMDKQKSMALAQQMGIDRGTIMLLQSGRAAVDDLINRQKELGAYTQEDTEIAAKANEAIKDLQKSLKSAAAEIMRHIVPAITWVTDHLTALVQDFRKHKSFYLSALGAIAAFLTAKLIPQLIKVGVLNAAVWAPYAALAAVITGLALVFDDLWVYMHGGKSALADYWKTLGTGPELLEKFQAKWESVKKSADGVLASIKNAAKSVLKWFAENIDSFILMFEGLTDIIEGLFNFDFEQIGRGLGKAFTSAWQLIENIFKDIFKGMDKMSIWDAIEKGAKKAWDAVSKLAKGFFDALPPEAQTKLKKVWEEFKNFIHWDEIKEKFKWDEIKTAAGNAWNEIKRIAKEVLEYLSSKFEYVSNIVDGIWTAINGLFNFDFKQLGEGLGKAFNSAWGLIKSFFDDIFGWFSDISSNSDSAWEMVTNAAKAAWDNLKEFASGFFSQLDPDLQALIKNAAALAGAWAIGKTITGLIGIGKEVSGLGKTITGVFNIVKAHPFGLLLAAISLIIANWDSIKKSITEFFDWLDKKWQNFKKAFAEFGIKVAEGEKEREEADLRGVTDSSDWSDPNKFGLPTTPRPAPADAVPAQAVSQTTQNVDASTHIDHSGKTEIIVQGAQDPMATAKAVKAEIENAMPPRLAPQAAGGIRR